MSKTIIKTNLFASKAPYEWAVVSNGILHTTQIPITKDGAIVEGGIIEQTKQCLDNLEDTLSCANSTMQDVVQVMIYVTQREHLAEVNKLYAEYFKPPYPNRAALVVAGLAREEMLVEFVVYAEIKN